MDVQIEHGKSYATARVTLAAGEAVKAEAGAMLAMKGDLQMQTSSGGGILQGLKRSLMGGESFFQNTFTAGPAGGTVWLAPPLPGDVHHARLSGNALIVQDGSYLASHPSVQVDTKWAGARGFFSGEGFVMLRVFGSGDLLLSSYGAIQEHRLAPGERLVVDTGHLVAFDEGMPHDVQRVTRGVKSLLFSGEGIVSAFTGPGTVWTQTRSSQSFLQWLSQRLPGGGGGGGGRGGFGSILGGQ